MAKLDIGPICHEHLLSLFSHHIHIPARAVGTRDQGGVGGGFWGNPPPLSQIVAKLEATKPFPKKIYCIIAFSPKFSDLPTPLYSYRMGLNVVSGTILIFMHLRLHDIL